MFANPALLVSRLLFVGLIVEAFEIFRLRRFFDDNEMFSRSAVAILTGAARWQIRIGATVGGSRAVTVAMAGQAFAAFVFVVAAAEVAVGLALIISMYRNRQTVMAEDVDSLKY